MLIGEIANKSGFTRDTIRYYEKIGLIQAERLDRYSNNYRNYSSIVLQRLIQISDLKTVGFTLTEIIDLLKDFECLNQPCADLPVKLDDKISQVESKIEALINYKKSLKKFEVRAMVIVKPRMDSLTALYPNN